MERYTAMYHCPPNKRPEALEKLRAGELRGVHNASAWWVNDFLYFYAESDEPAAAAPVADALGRVLETIGKGDDMRRMYDCIGIVREDKSLIRHRVFATQLKPDCAEEYYRRHKVLMDARGDAVLEGPESNFTIWCAAGKYIFGYCELVKAFDREMTEEERESTIAWETRQLEIMDWFTDDVDWITNEKHPAMECFWQQG